MDREQAEQLKALGALAVIFAHVGYVIFSGSTFLGPLSNYAGVAVNLFFFLSAYGLALSLSKDSHGSMGIFAFYQKRLARIVPLVWITLILFFILDFIIYSKAYESWYVVRSFLLIFPTADVVSDLNSPLWYITPLIAYYFAFPLIFKKGKAFFSAFLFLIFGYLLTQVSFIDNHFDLHYLAFPLGILCAGYSEKLKKVVKPTSKSLRLLIIFTSLIIVCVTSIYSGVGTSFEQYGSLIGMLALVSFVISSSYPSRSLAFIGTYSFEIYLLHFPFMSRFDVLHMLRPIPWIWLGCWMIFLFGTSLILERIWAMVPSKQAS